LGVPVVERAGAVMTPIVVSVGGEGSTTIDTTSSITELENMSSASRDLGEHGIL
jgi:hypothetical protein